MDGFWAEREMLFGAVLTADRARSIGEWLNQKADELEAAQADALQDKDSGKEDD